MAAADSTNFRDSQIRKSTKPITIHLVCNKWIRMCPFPSNEPVYCWPGLVLLNDVSNTLWINNPNRSSRMWAVVPHQMLTAHDLIDCQCSRHLKMVKKKKIFIKFNSFYNQFFFFFITIHLISFHFRVQFMFMLLKYIQQ